MYFLFYFKEFHSINESTTFIHNLIHDIGIRLKCYAVCVQIRRTKYGFINNEACLAYNELEFKNLYENSTNLTNIAKDFLRKHDKTLLVVQKNFDEINVEDEGGFSILK
jgi:tRNA U55 pseudouridine synthase TruB